MIPELNWTEVVPDRMAYAEGLLPPNTTALLMKSLQGLDTWSHMKFRPRGTGMDVPFPRLVAWHADPGIGYRYSGVEHPPADWTAELLWVRGVLERELGVRFNGVLLNRYRSGQDSIGRHSDREDDLVPGSPIVGVSLGATRTMGIRPVGGKAATEVRQALRDGSALLMHGDCQRALTHEIRKEPGLEGERISLTFRMVRPLAG